MSWLELGITPANQARALPTRPSNMVIYRPASQQSHGAKGSSPVGRKVSFVEGHQLCSRLSRQLTFRGSASSNAEQIASGFNSKKEIKYERLIRMPAGKARGENIPNERTQLTLSPGARSILQAKAASLGPQRGKKKKTKKKNSGAERKARAHLCRALGPRLRRLARGGAGWHGGILGARLPRFAPRPGAEHTHPDINADEP